MNDKPLAGLSVVVTRAAHQAEELAGPLRERGADVILLPVIGIDPPLNAAHLTRVIAEIQTYDWIVFTSVNGVLSLGWHQCRARVATVGAATRAYAEKHGWRVSVTPETYMAEALVAALGREDLRGKRILVPSAAVTRDVVREELTRRGAIVDVVEAYRNVIPAEAAAQAKEVWRLPFPDWVTFASSSAVENLVRLIGVDLLRGVKVATIGPVTSKTVLDRGLTVTAQAEPHTVVGLVDSIVHATPPAKTA